MRISFASFLAVVELIDAAIRFYLRLSVSVFDERKSGLISRSNFFGSAFSNSRLKASSLSRVFSLTLLFGFDFLMRGMPEA
jgi:hypothetical protein